MTDDITIAELHESDKEALRQLYRDVRLTNFYWMDLSSVTLSSFDLDTQGEIIFVAKVEGSVAGFISIWEPDNFIHHLFVGNQHQNRGVGTRLLNAVIPTLKSPVTLKCIKANTAAIRFYLRNGWKPKSENTSENGTYILFEHANAT